MRLVAEKKPKDYSSLFLGMILLGLVVTVGGLVMAATQSFATRARVWKSDEISRSMRAAPQNPANLDNEVIFSGSSPHEPR